MNAAAYQLALGWESGKEAELLAKDICEFAKQQVEKLNYNPVSSLEESDAWSRGVYFAKEEIDSQKKEILNSLS